MNAVWMTVSWSSSGHQNISNGLTIRILQLLCGQRWWGGPRTAAAPQLLLLGEWSVDLTAGPLTEIHLKAFSAKCGTCSIFCRFWRLNT